MNDASISYAQESDCNKLSETIADVIKAIPYYNDLAKRTEIEKFTPSNLQQKIEGDAYSVLVAKLLLKLLAFV